MSFILSYFLMFSMSSFNLNNREHIPPIPPIRQDRPVVYRPARPGRGC